MPAGIKVLPMDVNIWPKLHPNRTIPSCIFFSFALGSQPIQKKRWKLGCKRLKVVLLLHHVGPTLPEWGGPGKPQTPSRLQTDGKIFYETCSAHCKVHRPINHPKCKNGLEPPASGCPLRRPLQERSLCKVGQQRRRQHSPQSTTQPLDPTQRRHGPAGGSGRRWALTCFDMFL